MASPMTDWWLVPPQLTACGLLTPPARADRLTAPAAPRSDCATVGMTKESQLSRGDAVNCDGGGGGRGEDPIPVGRAACMLCPSLAISAFPVSAAKMDTRQSGSVVW
ncbi:hypothetical protein LZ30DRAFT_379399 [Colletotrichum cereale]|nr:hypothetical protein LZ30DRAFT_379399 [Colletotrichum cereale]